ncbi:MAG: hypothetical protein JWQ90_926 [Hydrocarboniphaga sp.]|uniref:hypothetical protein n=1 Tax=Hydrocarboniphaga sp. TaxID=2033016 RepID=UPI00261FC94C|nr:hypothetical protein [Hydrocarboniphaga sp.]MDB5968476.1 hypothetical protein [Hydrocarboniphaga sp.]
MAMKPFAVDQRQRELRHRSYLAVPTLGKQFPALEEIAIELRFVDPDRKMHLSPYKRIFASSMQAFFDFQCPVKECTGGGFNPTPEITKALSKSTALHTGTLSCKGKRDRGEAGNRCDLELHYQVVAVEKQHAGS